jgi:Ca2+-binding RTX toxin-like protein
MSNLRNFRLAASLALGLAFQTAVWSKPSIQSVNLSPNPLVTGLSFSIAVTASPDATQATAFFDFSPGQAPALAILLTKQGQTFTGSGVVPDNLRLRTNKDESRLKILLLDARGQKDEEVFHLDVTDPTVFATFSGGILTVSGDNQDNVLTVSRDTAGMILAFSNGTALAITGGVPTVVNTTLIRMLGLKGNDTLLLDDGNGPMPSANLIGGDGDDTLTGSRSVDDLDGGPGNDTLNGRDGDDHLVGGPGNDTLIGGRGEDQIFGGGGDDQVVWNPGDGNDLVEGENGTDTLVFNGANISEIVDISPNGQRLRFFRNVANITMDCDGIERVVFRALGGSDQVTVNDLTGTQVVNVLVDLTSSTGTGDGLPDTVIVNGTGTNDFITVTSSTNRIDVLGLAASVTVVGGEQDKDELIINALAGEDMVDASAVRAGEIDITLNGGDGKDLLIGGNGNDLLIGGRGDDTEFGGAGDDTSLWNPGDGNDTVEGQAGLDTLLFNGANIAEQVELSANGQRLRFTRNIGSIVMDCSGVEAVLFNATGGADLITINDLSGTDVSRIDLNLKSPPDSDNGDNSVDSIVIKGTTGDDVIVVTGSPATGVTVQGLAATVNIIGSEPALDQLRIDALSGDDAVQASSLEAGVINLTADGGPGDDILVGSPGDDVLIGGDDDDVLIGGDGADVLDGGPGNNVVIQ